MEINKHVSYGPYEKYFKRILDIICSLLAIILFSWLYVILIILGAIFMRGNPFFTQERPGKDEKIFKLIKFRTMSTMKDKNGNLLPDSVRLNTYGRFLRSTSLDELPSLFNIVIGDLSIVGPRPQLVRDMVFMSEDQRRRHSVRPGLTGLAQVNGRNNITWLQKFEYDLEYIKNITFLNDVKIILKTVKKVIIRADVVRDGTDSDMDFGDWLLNQGAITYKIYKEKQAIALELLRNK